ncbi:hypothetical protein [Levilactobacillus fujinensis]|uniref:Uncharacterized protein n=1 Tax=Levilactobacillus fujinensis TaxID=2486024 RepID=A0ABW1TDZ6_9LACO
MMLGVLAFNALDGKGQAESATSGNGTGRRHYDSRSLANYRDYDGFNSVSFSQAKTVSQ